MPFKECSLMESREEFCRLALHAGVSRRELCRRWGISPQTGYKWLGRYADSGIDGLRDQSRRPLSSPERTSAELEVQVLAVRAEHPVWGGRKIRKVLQNEGLAAVPSASTITEILRRHGLLEAGSKACAPNWQRFEHAEPNDLWQMDFKGHFALRRGRCHPLTVLDDHSRYALAIGACDNERTATVQAWLTGLFKRYGLPRNMLTDNGSPWGTAGSWQRHTVLSVWLLDLGIGIRHGRPGHPQTQGKEERFHRTLKAEVLDGREFDDIADAQRAFDRWRPIYNFKRPHEALDMNPPMRRYETSPRSMPSSIAPPDYEPQAHVRSVNDGGAITFRKRRVPVPKAFAGKKVALRATDTDGLFDLCYRSHVLGQVDLAQNMVKTVHHVSEHLSPLSPV